MVTEKDNNSDKSITPEQALNIIKAFCSENLPNFILIREYLTPPFWGINYTQNKIEVILEGDYALQAIIKISDTKYPLWQFNKELKNHHNITYENINLILNNIYNFLK
ncbi:MAG: hypothetical protein WBA23_08110 [Tunicatimonas sp.]|uniref:hypothetical protein n=1 Tax=Tunicatimonas sp. TaxID=1940096 RepID=UPI003C73DCAE